MERPTGPVSQESSEAALRTLFVAALAGDAPAYRVFLTRLSSHLRAFFRKRLAQWPDDVEDLVQETLMAVHRQRHTYRPDEPLTAWVHAIARYKLADLLRARMRREALSDPWDDELSLFAATDDEAAHARRDLAQLMQGLSRSQRQAIESVKLGGYSVAETAQGTGMSPSAVKVGIHRGLKALAAKLRKPSK